MAVVQLGRGSVPKQIPATTTDVIGGAIINYLGSGTISGPMSGTEFAATSGYIGGVYSGYALSGGSTHVGGFWPMQAGLWSGTTDGTGQASIVFPYAFANTPSSVVATVEGSDYAVRIVSRATTSFTAKVLQAKVNWTSGAVLGSGLGVSAAAAVTSVPTSGGNVRGVGADFHNDFAATTSGGVAGDPFLAIESTGVGTFLTSVNATTDDFVKSGITTNSGVAVVSVSGFLTAAANVSVRIDWMAAA